MRETLSQMREGLFPLEPSFRHVLYDFRTQLFQRFALMAAVVACLAAYGVLLQANFRSDAFTFFIGGALMAWGLSRTPARHFDPARYALVALIVIGAGGVMVLSPSAWSAFLIAPVALVAGLLISHSAPLLVMGWAGWVIVMYPAVLNVAGVITLGVMTVVIMVTVATFHVALSWYGSMHRRADQLLQETRDRRAELVQALKSLDTAYKTQSRLQQQLIYARRQANEARRLKERFAANISHELRTPLNLILGFSEIMYLNPSAYGNDLTFSPRLTRDIYQIYNSSRHLLEMIDDVLDLSQVELSSFALNFERTDLNAFLADTVLMIQNLFRDPSVQLIVHIAPDLPMLEIDRTRIRQVLLNLFNNARRFTSSGAVTFTVERAGYEVVFRVADTGIGIPPDKVKYIFDEFFQVDYSLSRSHGGAGLGLTISRRFVEAHSGSIHAESREGHGSVFTFSLPLPEIPTFYGRTGDSGTESPARDESQPVLVVEDDIAVVTMIRRHLPGYVVVQVEREADLTEALALHRPRAVIRNVHPHRTQTPLPVAEIPVPVIECSLPGAQWLAEQLGVSAALAKPITARQLAEQIARFAPVERILIVDDDIGFVQLVQRTIETLDRTYTLLRAYDGEQALALAREHLPDLLVLDIAMPDMNGFEVIEALRASHATARIPILLLTATRYIQSDSEHHGLLRVQQGGGLLPAEVLRSLSALVDTLRPRYDESYFEG